ncbi:MAG: SGNH/GDSL hydrolase family protein [Thermoleophilaceae bacterium]|nr:SGNH/GDSL hydrolase family protein [Thermoleophilaceae bacterium]
MQELHPRLTRPLAAFLAIAICAIGFLFARTAMADAAGRYVALGDSSSTGSGLGTQYPGSRQLCWQTQNSYPVFIASALAISDFTSATCSASWVNDLTTSQDLYDPATSNPIADIAPPQANALNGTETLVTMSIGINDSGYGDIVDACLVKPTPATPCKDSSTYNNFVSRANALLSSPLGDAIDEIHRRSPNAEVWVIGYPRLIPEDVSNCPGKVDISAGDALTVNAWQRALNDTERATTESHNAFYVDVFSASTGHDACQTDAAARWQNPGPSASPSGWSLHPTLAGQQAVAQLFVHAFQSQTLAMKFRSKKVRSVASRLAPITTTSPKAFGARFEVTLARSGTVEFFIDRAKPGRIKGGRCRSMPGRTGRNRKACTRYKSVSSGVALALPGGSSSVYFTGRAGGKRLAAGKYRLRARLGTLSAKTPTFKLSN